MCSSSWPTSCFPVNKPDASDDVSRAFLEDDETSPGTRHSARRRPPDSSLRSRRRPVALQALSSQHAAGNRSAVAPGHSGRVAVDAATRRHPGRQGSSTPKETGRTPDSWPERQTHEARPDGRDS